MHHPIKFEQISWTSPVKGIREKRIEQAEQVMRLVEFSHGFVEEDWCTKGHIGYIVEGSFSINFDGNMVPYREGEGLWIGAGEDHKHKAILGEGEKVLLLLFEKCQK